MHSQTAASDRAYLASSAGICSNSFAFSGKTTCVDWPADPRHTGKTCGRHVQDSKHKSAIDTLRPSTSLSEDDPEAVNLTNEMHENRWDRMFERKRVSNPLWETISMHGCACAITARGHHPELQWK